MSFSLKSLLCFGNWSSSNLFRHLTFLNVLLSLLQDLSVASLVVPLSETGPQLDEHVLEQKVEMHSRIEAQSTDEPVATSAPRLRLLNEITKAHQHVKCHH